MGSSISSEQLCKKIFKYEGYTYDELYTKFHDYKIMKELINKNQTLLHLACKHKKSNLINHLLKIMTKKQICQKDIYNNTVQKNLCKSIPIQI